MDTVFHIATILAAIGLFVFIVIASLGFGSGPDAEELEHAEEALADKEAQLIDVRTPSEFAQNGVDEAINVPVQQLENRLHELGDTADPVVVYCRTGNRSAHARQMLEDAGFEEVYDVGDRDTADEVSKRAR